MINCIKWTTINCNTTRGRPNPGSGLRALSVGVQDSSRAGIGFRRGKGVQVRVTLPVEATTGISHLRPCRSFTQLRRRPSPDLLRTGMHSLEVCRDHGPSRSTSSSWRHRIRGWGMTCGLPIPHRPATCQIGLWQLLDGQLGRVTTINPSFL
jgi:hypothetical protein